jgi:hypothetical protein
MKSYAILEFLDVAFGFSFFVDTRVLFFVSSQKVHFASLSCPLRDWQVFVTNKRSLFFNILCFFSKIKLSLLLFGRIPVGFRIVFVLCLVLFVASGMFDARPFVFTFQ